MIMIMNGPSIMTTMTKAMIEENVILIVMKIAIIMKK
jgi:hypothetical protein